MKQDKDYLLPAPGVLQERQPVELEIISETDLGYKAVVDDLYIGLIYRSEISQPLQIGQYLRGWVKLVRPDGKIDLSITLLDAEGRSALEDAILRYLHNNGGRANLSDKSSPEEVHALFQTSKKNFKRAIGRLYKAHQIVINDDSITLVGKAQPQTASPWGKRSRS